MGTNHRHAHGHKHDEINSKNLFTVTALNIVITIAEIIGGLLSNSLALLSDAIHNLGDTVAIFLAYIANKISKREATTRKTFGYKRIEILAALFNSIALVVITIFLFREAWLRLGNPEPIKGLMMFIVASVGLLANFFAVILLKNDSKKNINIKAAYLHLLGDTISSVAVIIGSVLIYFYKIYWIDPVLTILIGLYILKETYSVLREAVDILMQATPRSVKIPDVKKELEEIPGIDNIHHIHIWQLSDNQIHFECHADTSTDLKITETEEILEQFRNILKTRFSITHITVQFEHYCCNDKNLINIR